MKIHFLLCACAVITTGLINATEQAHFQESESTSKRLLKTKIVEYESLLKNVEHSQSPAKNSIGSYYQKYLADLESLQARVDEGKEHINIPKQLHSIFLQNNPEAGGYSY